MFLTKIDQLRANDLEWGRTYLWDCWFPNAPAPFNQWFPATEVEEGIATLTPHEFEGYLGSFKVPKSTTDQGLRLTFADDVNCTLCEWISYWINEWIFNGVSGTKSRVRCLEDSVRQVHIMKLDLQRNPVKTSYYAVFPTGSVNFVGNSESGLPSYAVEFVIAGATHKLESTTGVESKVKNSFSTT